MILLKNSTANDGLIAGLCGQPLQWYQVFDINPLSAKNEQLRREVQRLTRCNDLLRIDFIAARNRAIALEHEITLSPKR